MWTIRRSVGSETRIRPWAVAWLSVTSRNRSGHEVSLQAVERLELPDHLLFFLQRSGQQVTLVPELFGVPFDLFDQPGHPRQDQKEDGPGPEGESCRVRRFAQKGLHGEDTRDHQRRSGKKDQPPPRSTTRTGRRPAGSVHPWSDEERPRLPPRTRAANRRRSDCVRCTRRRAPGRRRPRRRRESGTGWRSAAGRRSVVFPARG